MSQSLVSGFHNEVRSGERFFELLSKMLEDPARFLPVLELMYMCLSLGFMGRYRLSPRGPAEIDRLREEVYAAIAGASAGRGGSVSGLARRRCAIPAARPPCAIVGCGSAGLALIGGCSSGSASISNGASDAVYDRALRAPPTTMPAIVRTAPAQPPKAAPATAEAGALDRLKDFLAAEIDAGQVGSLAPRPAGRAGATSGPVRLGQRHGRSGSPWPVPGRIGSALKAETGPVQVVGYTDNQPIRTVRFPSNYQLSAASAAAASAINRENDRRPNRLWRRRAGGRGPDREQCHA